MSRGIANPKFEGGGEPYMCAQQMYGRCKQTQRTKEVDKAL